MNRRIYALRCGVQHYAWGETGFIPSLLGIGNHKDKPFAELWMGAHPDLPSEADVDGRHVSLAEIIDKAPEDILGQDVAQAFEGRLPYLFKVLSAAAPLSIQAHPSLAMAREGFARENTAGISLSDPRRNYRDDNHKPELIAALTDFYALRGFRPLSKIADELAQHAEFCDLMSGFRPTPANLKTLYERFMALSQEQVDRILEPLIERLQKADSKRPFTRQERAYWVLTADREYSQNGHRDRGLFSIYLLNLVHLKPGQAMYLPAGVLHAYLQGSGMEIMANSNNVLRGGLTPKHVDVPELIANVTFEGGEPEIISPAQNGNNRRGFVYRTPTREFELHRLELDGEHQYASPLPHSADMLVVETADEQTDITIVSGEQSMSLHRGHVLLAPYGVPYTITASRPVVLYRATVPPPTRESTARADYLSWP